MILEKLSLKDFGAFRGEHEIALAPEVNRPIVLFGGKNGAGKTTLLDGIRLCLYGPGALEERVSRDEYLTFLDNKIHSSPQLLIQPTFAEISVDFRHSELGAVHIYKVVRSWQRRSSSKIVEQLQVYRNGSQMSDLAADQWQDFIRELVPPGLSQLFFFDGEKIQQLAGDTYDKQALSDAIKCLLGLDYAERLSTDLEIYLARALRNVSSRDATDELTRNESEIIELNRMLLEKERAREEHAARLKAIQAEIGRLEGRIAGDGGRFAQNRESLVVKRAELSGKISQLENTIRELANELLPFALIPELCTKLLDQLTLEEQGFEHQVAERVLGQARVELLGMLDKERAQIKHTTRGQLETVLSRLRSQVENMRTPSPARNVKTLHNMGQSEVAQLRTWISQSMTNSAPLARKCGVDLETLNRELHRVQELLRKAPGDDALKPLVDGLSSLNRDLGQTTKELALVEADIKQSQVALADVERRQRLLTDKLATQIHEGSKFRLVPQLQKVLDEYGAHLIARKIVELEDLALEFFRRISRKKDVVHRIAIDPKNFSTTLFDKAGRQLHKSSLSAGEKQIYSIALLWALAKTSGRPLPIIIDTPLGRLDSDHRRLLIDHYFPSASHQMIVLSTDTEIDRPVFEGLKPYVSHAYQLEFDADEHETRVLPGYFWGHPS